MRDGLWWMSGALLLAAGCVDGPTLTKLNTEPAVVFVSHEDGGAIDQPGRVRFVALTTDPESPAEDLEVAWTVDGLAACEGAVVDVDDRAPCEVDLLGGTHEISVSVTDPDGARSDAQITVEVLVPNTAPACGFSTPEDQAVLEEGAALLVSGEVSDDQSSPPELSVQVSSSLDGVLGEVVPTTGGDFTLSVDDLSGGTHVLTLRVEDPEGALCTEARSVHVVQAPALTLVAPAEGAVVDLGDAVTLEALVVDPDGAVSEAQVSWSSDLDGTLGLSMPSSAGEAVLVTSALSRGTHTWAALAMDVDGLTDRAERTLVVNGPPTAPGVAITPAAPLPGESLVAQVLTPSQDQEGDPITYAYTWLRGGVVVGTQSTIGSGVTARQEVWTLRVEPHDGRISGPAAELSVTIGNRAPVATDVVLSPVDPITGEALFALPGGSDADGDELSWTFVWRVDGVVVQSSAQAELAGRTRGESVEVEAVASDGLASSGSVIAGPVVIGNAAAAITGVTISPQTPASTDTLTCIPSGWTDAEGDAPGFRWQWRVDGVLAPSLSQSTVAASLIGPGLAISCTAIPWDGFEEGQPRTSSEVSIGNSPPRVVSAALEPVAPTRLEAIELVDVLTSDADGDVVTVSVAWLVEGVQVGTGNRLPAGFHLRGDVVTAQITPHDGQVSGPMLPVSVVVANALPELASASLSPTNPRTDSTLSGSWSGSDPDDDLLSATWTWEVDGVAVVGVTGAQLGGLYFAEGQQVRATVTVADGFGGFDQLLTNTVTVGNTAPGAPVLRIDPPVSDTTIGLVCGVHTPSQDIDGDAVSYRMSWRLNGAPFVGPTGTTLWPGDTVAPTHLVPGRWTCRATPFDGDEDGAVGTDDARVVPVYEGPRLAASGGQVCALLDGGAVVCWGDNLLGALGQGDTFDRGDDPGEVAALTPVPLGTGRHATQVAVGGDLVCALLDDGGVKCWGDNLAGQLGQGDTTRRGGSAGQLGDALDPVALGGEVDVAQVVAGHAHACVRTRDGRVKCWGDNSSGALGLGDMVSRGVSDAQLGDALPWVDLGTDRGAVDLAAGDGVTCAVLDDASVKCWGVNGLGVSGAPVGGIVGDQAEEMGDDLPAVSLPPGEVVDVETAGDAACARFVDGTVVCWGDNGVGQLGQGDTTSRSGDGADVLEPVDLGTSFVVAEVSMAPGLVCARAEGGEVKCWGANSDGQLGQGDVGSRGRVPGDLGDALPPISLHTTQEVLDVAAGGTFACVSLSCGDVQCWGSGPRGQIGLGDERVRGDAPRELGDALPTVPLGSGRRLWTDEVGTPGCARWSRSITVDGRDDDWTDAEVLATSAGGTTALMVSWDETYLYLGTRHPDVASVSNQYWFVAYFGNGSDRAAVVTEPGFRFGISHNTQVPGLAVESQYVARTQATLAFDQLAAANYPGGSALWEGGNYALSSGGGGGQLARNTGERVIELRVRRDALQLHRVLYLQTHWLFEGSGSESSYAASPVDMFADGTYDPEFDTYWRFELDHPLGPEAGTEEAAVP